VTTTAHAPERPRVPTGSEDPEGFARLLGRVASERGFQGGRYKERCLHRRISVRMRARGAHTYDAYLQVLDADAEELDRLVDALTINVTKLFRNWDAWSAVAERAIPGLWARPDEELRVWSAGASSGEEAYSLAALFHRHAELAGEPERAGRVQVLGTDIDRPSLAAAARAVYVESAFADTPPSLRARYFAAGSPAAVAPELRSLVRFARLDLLRDPAPPGPWHFISCRNVLIYFDREAQEALIERFARALVPGGILFLGKVETLLGPVRARFAPVDQRERIFRRLPDAR
jgi:chemotaxis methyl-accepting protein methylase